MTDPIIPAQPGFWELIAHDFGYGDEPSIYRRPVVAWIIKSDGAIPVSIADDWSESFDRWAVEEPSGRVFEVITCDEFSSFDTWRDEVLVTARKAHERTAAELGMV